MKLQSNRGFGIGTLIVIIAIVLIIGAYMYYSGGKSANAPEMAPSATEETTTGNGGTTVPATMETGPNEVPANTPSAPTTY